VLTVRKDRVEIWRHLRPAAARARAWVDLDTLTVVG